MALLQEVAYCLKAWAELALICAIISLCSISGSMAAATGNATVVLNAGTYNITMDSSGYDVIVMDGFCDRVDTGNPLLPQKTFDVLLPPNVDDSSLQLRIVSSKTEVLGGTYDIKPSPEWLPQSFNETPAEISKNTSTYEKDTDYPENFVLLQPPSKMRKWNYVPVDFIPFQYNPVTKMLTLHDNVTIEISYSLKDLSSGTAASLADTVLDHVAQTKFINYNEMSGWYAPEENLKLEPGAVSDYVIITTNAIEAGSSKLNAFVAHKQNIGYSVRTVTEDDFDGLTGQAPNQRAEKIRQWLKNNYISNGIKYVLLIGNPTPYESGGTDIPMKMCWPMLGGSYPESPTDYFYADLTGNWNIDGDGYYGEWTDYKTTGGVDLAADVYVGRIPVYSADYTTLDSILQKIIDYETSSSTAWRKSALLPMSFSDSSTDGAYLGEQMKDDYLTANSYPCWRMYQHGASGACTLNSAFSSEENLRGGSVVPDRWADSDFGLVSWWGHGNSQGAYVGYNTCSDGAFMLSSYAPSLDDDHPSHTYQCSCTNGYPEDSGNLQYAVLKNGGITTTGATRVSWYYVGQTSFAGSNSNAGMGYEYMKLLAQGEAAGDALYDMKSSGVSSPGSYSEILMNFYDFCLYGDPSISMENPVSSPTVTNSVGATATTTSSARLNGEITSTGGLDTTAHIYWGDNDGRVDSTGWDHDENLGTKSAGTFYKDISGLTPENTYYYRCFASNSVGSRWASLTKNFISSPIKSGATVPGATNWKAYGSNAIYLDVDTSAAGFTSTPIYVTSLGGWGCHWDAQGADAVYAPTPTGFRIYLHDNGGGALTPALANQRGWYIQWIGIPDSEANAGSTVAGSTNWRAYGSNAIYLDVDTSAAGFTSTPVYLTSIGGSCCHWDAQGADAVYAPTPTGFRIYIHDNSGGALTPALANQRGWYIQWVGIPESEANAGSTVVGSTNWMAYGSNAIYLDVDTSAAGFTSTPVYVATLGGWSNHWDAQGTSAVYAPTATGFRIYLHDNGGGALTPALANQRGWYVQWIGIPTIKANAGSTVAGSTNWMAYGSNAIYLDVDTSAAAFTSTPIYVATLGGWSNHWDAQGANAIYAPTATGFRIYLHDNSGYALTPALANQRGWYVQWIGIPKSEVNADSTTAGSTNWVAYGSNAIYLDVDTSAAGFTSTPVYLASIGGWSNHWDAQGANAIYAPTATGFRIYLHDNGGGALTPALANQRGWYVQWIGIPISEGNAGSTTAGATNWKAYGSNAVYLDVDTSAAGFTSTPAYLTSIGGSCCHWDAQGADAIYAPTATGFRIYLHDNSGNALTPALANQRGWYVQWLGIM